MYRSGECLELEAIALHKSAGADPERFCNVRRIAVRVGVDVEIVSLPMPRDAALDPEGRRPCIYLRAGIGELRSAVATAHELAELILLRAGHNDTDLERLADRLGEAILRPRPAVLRAVTGRPWVSIREVASRLGLTEIHATRRLEQVAGTAKEWPAKPDQLEHDLPSGVFKIAR